MVTNILLTGKHNVRVNAAGKIKVDGNILNIEKDIPFVRYRFESYGDDDIEYIRQMKDKFNKSVHLVQVNLDENTVSVLERLASMGVAKYVYIPVTTDIVSNCSFGSETLAMVEKLRGLDIDRIMILDKSDNLYTDSKDKLIRQLSVTLRLTRDKFGVCGSPLSFIENQCLSALKARELMSLYSQSTDVTLPSANHQSMNCCGCIRHFIVDSDTVEVGMAGNNQSGGKTGETKKSGNKKQKDVSKTGESGNGKAVKKKSKGNVDMSQYLF